MCKLFITTLRNKAQKWFKKLALHTIASFDGFAKMIITNYVSNKPMRKEYHHLFSITQGNDETIRDYMRRFKEKNMEIIYCLSSIVIDAFRRGLLRSLSLFIEIMKMVLHTMEETYVEAQNVDNLEVKGFLVLLTREEFNGLENQTLGEEHFYPLMDHHLG